MKLLGDAPPAVTRTQADTLIPELPTKRVVVEKVTDQTGNGPWWDGRVLFISKAEVVIIPTRCRAGNYTGAASRMPRAARKALPKGMRKGDAKRITKIIVEVKEHASKS